MDSPKKSLRLVSIGVQKLTFKTKKKYLFQRYGVSRVRNSLKMPISDKSVSYLDFKKAIRRCLKVANDRICFNSIGSEFQRAIAVLVKDPTGN